MRPFVLGRPVVAEFGDALGIRVIGDPVSQVGLRGINKRRRDFINCCVHSNSQIMQLSLQAIETLTPMLPSLTNA